MKINLTKEQMQQLADAPAGEAKKLIKIYEQEAEKERLRKLKLRGNRAYGSFQ